MQTDHVAHVKECVRYGVQPLTGAQIVRMHSSGLQSLQAAFSIASDIQAGFTWVEAVEAFKRAEGLEE